MKNSNFNQQLGYFIDDLFNKGINSFWSDRMFNQENFANVPVNIHDGTNGYQMSVVAPGLEKSDFNLNVDGNILTISYEKSEEKTEDADNWVRKEFSMKSFKRSFTLNEKVDGNKISAQYENGILEIFIPKKEIAIPKKVEITVI